MPGKVKCIDCGYFSRRNLTTSELVSAEEIYRANPLSDVRIGGPPSEFAAIPICAMGVPDFTTWADGYVEASIVGERECSHFTEWQRAFTPKEHIEMDMVRRQQQYLLERERADRRWRIIELLVMGVLVTLVSALVQIGAAFIERGSLFPDRAVPQPVSVEGLPAPTE